MKLDLFDFVENAAYLLEENLPSYLQVQEILEGTFDDLLAERRDILVAFSSRVKGKESLKEKIIRNKYYLKHETPQQTLDHLADLVGLTLECRFISEENILYQELFKHFVPTKDSTYQCIMNPSIYLDLSQKQPQKQRNGFTIYRLDGYVLHEGNQINFELQVKSLVHRFWGEIEHQVVYKNNHFILYDYFMKNILGSILDNLELVDHQLETVYQQISSEQGKLDQIGFGESGFKLFIAKSINDLVAIKMNEEVGFTTNFKHCSSILSQYIYIKDFLDSENPQYRMAEYIEHFNLLKESDFDFTEQIFLEKKFSHPDGFCTVLGCYWERVLNADYEWHVFFMMLFVIQPGNNIQDFTQFVEVIKRLLFTAVWPKVDASQLLFEKEAYERILAECLVRIEKIDIIHEENIIAVSTVFQNLIIDEIQEKEGSIKNFEVKLEKQLMNLF